MNKKMVTWVMAMGFVLSSIGAGYAATVDCKVESVDGSRVVLNCSDDAGKIVNGTTVTVKTAKKKAIEGC